MSVHRPKSSIEFHRIFWRWGVTRWRASSVFEGYQLKVVALGPFQLMLYRKNPVVPGTRV